MADAVEGVVDAGMDAAIGAAKEAALIPLRELHDLLTALQGVIERRVREVQSLGELRASWQALGPDLDAVGAEARSRA